MNDPHRATPVNIRLNKSFLERSLPKQLLICGPAGTGKTFGVLCFLHILAADHPNLRFLICRQTRVSLTESVLATFEKFVLPEDGMERLTRGAKRANRHSYDYPNGSQIVLGGLEDPERIFSTSWDAIYVNEAIEVEEAAWDILWTRLNRPGHVPWLGHLIGDTNPGDPNHWLKRRCEAGDVTLWDTGHEANPMLFSRREWLAAGLLYLGSLGTLRGTRRKRLLHGEWAAGEGAWFETFDASTHVHERAEFDPRWPVHLSVDTGVYCGAVWWQVRGEGPETEVTVFGDYLSNGVPAFDNAKAILAMGQELTRDRRLLFNIAPATFDVGSMDPAGNAENGTGLVIDGEFQRAGLKLHAWPKYAGCIASGLALVESFVAVDLPRLIVHPRCKHLIDAFANYKRKKRGGQWIDEPEDPQHPYEDLIDCLRSGLLDKWPEGRKPAAKLTMIPGRRVF